MNQQLISAQNTRLPGEVTYLFKKPLIDLAFAFIIEGEPNFAKVLEPGVCSYQDTELINRQAKKNFPHLDQNTQQEIKNLAREIRDLYLIHHEDEDFQDVAEQNDENATPTRSVNNIDNLPNHAGPILYNNVKLLWIIKETMLIESRDERTSTREKSAVEKEIIFPINLPQNDKYDILFGDKMKDRTASQE